MRATRAIMGMPVTVELVGAPGAALEAVFEYFSSVDKRFSTYKPESEIMQINRGEHGSDAWSAEVQEVFALAEETSESTLGFFSIVRPDGTIDPSGIVKGWAIRNAALLAESLGYENYFIDAGGDIQSKGTDEAGNAWTIGIRNPFNAKEIVKVVCPAGSGVATSGTSMRGQHIYNPHEPGAHIEDIVSLTVIAPDIYEADRYATAAFAMGKSGIGFIEQVPELEGYVIDAKGIATMTSGFHRFTLA